MTMSIYDASVATFARFLRALDANLDALAKHCEATKVDPAVFLGARLFPDMFPLSQQIQMACEFAKNASARLAGIDPPSHPDTEQTLAELKARIAKTVDFVTGLDTTTVEAGAARIVKFRTGPDQWTEMPGASYLTGFAGPNFFFHATTAYAIMRHNGLPIGKRQFFGPM
ncbi:MAG: DUF1993 domain-containing protein [Caulobacterales bacterium]